MTNEELANLKVLAKQCYIFGNQERYAKISQELALQLSQNNQDFFIIAVNVVPDIIDELIELRQYEKDTSYLDDLDTLT